VLHKRTEYGIGGTHVNLTARIESYTVGGQILISESTRQEVGPILRIAQQIEIEVKGIDGPITSTMYEVSVGSTISFCLREKIASSLCPRAYLSSIPFWKGNILAETHL
jgi:adenylate cyclase